MRDILFRAKLKDTNYWAEGFYCSMRETTYCCEEDYKRHPVPLHHLIAVDEMTDWGMPNRLRLYEINPETLCQYTGLCDKNGKKIWENDIVQYGEYTAVVRHGKYTAGFYVDFPEETNYRKDLGYWYKKVSVIGNVLEDTKGNRLESHTVSEPGWIPVTERLPENDSYVLMSFENFYDFQCWSTFDLNSSQSFSRTYDFLRHFCPIFCCISFFTPLNVPFPSCFSVQPYAVTHLTAYAEIYCFLQFIVR